MRQELPFTRQNRPWLTSDCIEAMNEQFMVCISQIAPEQRENLRDWAATKVEMGYCHDRPEILEACKRWGVRQGVPPEAVGSTVPGR